MACQAEQDAVDAAVAQVDAFAAERAADFSRRAEAETAEVSGDLEDDDDIAAALGATAGAAAGATIGPATAAAGAVIGREIGRLFLIDIEMRRVSFAMDIPQVRVERKTIGLDLPQVTMRNRDIIFHTPSVRMKRVKGPPKPEVVCEGVSWRHPVPRCTVRWTDTWLDMPEVFMEEQRIVLGVPEVRMERTDIVLDVPATRMERQEFAFDVPAITVRSKMAEARKVGDKAKELSRQYEREGEALTDQVKELSKERIAPRLTALFDCHRSQLRGQIEAAPRPFDTALATIAESMAQLTARGVPSDDDDYVALVRQRDALLADRAAAVTALETALRELEAAERSAMENFVDA